VEVNYTAAVYITLLILNFPYLLRDRRSSVLTVRYRSGLYLNHRMGQYHSGTNTSSVPIFTQKHSVS